MEPNKRININIICCFFFILISIAFVSAHNEIPVSKTPPKNSDLSRNFYVTSKDLCPDPVLYEGGPGDPKLHTESPHLNLKFLDIPPGVEVHLPLTCVSTYNLAKDFDDGYTFEPLAVILIDFEVLEEPNGGLGGRCDLNLKFKGQDTTLPDHETYSCRYNQTNSNFTLLLNSKARILHFWEFKSTSETADKYLKLHFLSFYNSTSCYTTEQLHLIDRTFGGDQACLHHKDEITLTCSTKRLGVSDCLSEWENHNLPAIVSEIFKNPSFKMKERKQATAESEAAELEDSHWDDRVSRLISVSLAGIIWLYFVFYGIGNMVGR